MLDAVCPPGRMRYSIESRCRIVQLILAGESPQAAAAACGASRATGYRLWRRYLEGGWAALADRHPVPKRQPRRLSSELEQRILAAREYAKAGPLVVAGQLGLPASTVWKVLRRYGVSRLPRPTRGPVVRYERARPGELLHVGIKKLRLHLGGVLVADRPDRTDRLHGRRLPRRRRAPDRQWRTDRQEGEGSRPERMVRQPDLGREVVPVTSRLRLHVPGAQSRRGPAVAEPMP